MTGNSYIIDLGAFDLTDTVPHLHDVRWYLYFENRSHAFYMEYYTNDI